MKKLLSFFLLFIPIVSYSIDVNTYIPPRAFTYKKIIREEISKHFPTLSPYEYIPSLIEHESCISLKHSRCWQPSSRLKSSREEGAGLAQITRTFREDGSIRFDTLSDMVRLHKRELKELSWENVYTRADLQIRFMILLTRDNFNKLYDIPEVERLPFADAAYNGGLRDVNKQRMICKLKDGCIDYVWFNNVGDICVKSTKPLYGNRSACDINKHHVRDVILVKMPKYLKYYNLYSN